MSKETREIKFRAWDGKKMHLPEYSDNDDFFITCEGEIMYRKEVGTEGHTLNYERKGWILMLFTGLQDKNKNYIYEGDILKTDSGANQYVEYRNDMAQFVCRFTKGASTNIQTSWEVIGNLYENHELITSKT